LISMIDANLFMQFLLKIGVSLFKRICQ
jgi:hypothetical protein